MIFLLPKPVSNTPIMPIRLSMKLSGHLKVKINLNLEKMSHFSHLQCTCL